MRNTLPRLLDHVRAAAPGVVDADIGTEGVSSTVRVEPASQQAAAQAAIDSFDWSPAAHAAWLLDRAREAAKALYDAQGEREKLLRAVSKLTVDRLNVIHQWVTSFKAAVALAANLADLKTRVAALGNLPDLTYAQARSAILSLIDGE